jgi:hypothetical protein
MAVSVFLGEERSIQHEAQGSKHQGRPYRRRVKDMTQMPVLRRRLFQIIGTAHMITPDHQRSYHVANDTARSRPRSNVDHYFHLHIDRHIPTTYIKHFVEHSR